MKITKIMPPTYMLIAMLVMVALNIIFPVVIIIPDPWNLLGIIPVGLGVYIAVVAEASFRNAKTTVTPFDKSSTLVTKGMYRISRNPMYLGFVLVLIGIAILMKSLMPFGVIPIFMAIIEINFIRIEERMLITKFGVQYSSYAKDVRRWL